MPRIAVTLLWLGVIVAAVGLNMARYPGVSQMVRDSCQPQPLAQAVTPASSASPAPPAPISAKAENQPAATAERPALAAQPVEAKDPPTRSPASTVPVVPVAQAVSPAEPPAAADPLDLGNGVRRLPPVD